MARNNVKPLTEEQRIAFNKKYVFEYDFKTDEIIVKFTNYGRITTHNSNKNFSINSNIRKITFTVDAINIWKELYVDKETRESLIDVQNAANNLYVTYQEISLDSVKRFIRNWDGSMKVKEI